MAGTEAGTKRRRSVCGRKPRKGVGLYMPVNPACDVPLSRRSPLPLPARCPLARLLGNTDPAVHEFGSGGNPSYGSSQCPRQDVDFAFLTVDVPRPRSDAPAQLASAGCIVDRAN